MFYKKDGFKNFVKFTAKHLCRNPFFTLLKKGRQRNYFTIIFAKFFRTLFLRAIPTTVFQTEILGQNGLKCYKRRKCSLSSIMLQFTQL